MTRNLGRIAAAAAALAALAACAPDHGVVTSVDAVWNPQNKQMRYQVCVRGDDGKTGCDPVLLDVYLKCRKGDRWPDCGK